MFTGLIEQQALVIANLAGDKANRLLLHSTCLTWQIGESIAVNGVCLTLLFLELFPDANHLIFDVSPETLALTTLGQLRIGDTVNLERAMLAGSRFGGHYVTGHVNTTACLHAINQTTNQIDDTAWSKLTPRRNIGNETITDHYIEITVGDFEPSDYRYLIPKGSITIDGVSLTINAVNETSITIMLVPHTLTLTTLNQLVVGQRLNVEFDYFTRIVAHQIAHRFNLSLRDKIKEEFLL